MTDRPMIFSAPMVRALLKGRKTQTRRALKPPYGIMEYRADGSWGPIVTNIASSDRIWVRETWADTLSYPNEAVYRADGERPHSILTWRSPMCMPRWASRLTLIVTEVRVQRLQEISEEDARAEGVSPLPSGRYHCGYDEEGEITCKSPVTAYGWLWNSLNAKRGYLWESNPWVCALTFRAIQQNIDAPPTGSAADM